MIVGAIEAKNKEGTHVFELDAENIKQFKTRLVRMAKRAGFKKEPKFKILYMNPPLKKGIKRGRKPKTVQ